MRRLTIATVLALSALAAAASAQPAEKPPQRNSTPYPASVRNNFMPACMKDNVLNEAQCGCIHRNMEREYPLAEYVEIDQAALEKRDHPAMKRVQEIVVACYTNPAY